MSTRVAIVAILAWVVLAGSGCLTFEGWQVVNRCGLWPLLTGSPMRISLVDVRPPEPPKRRLPMTPISGYLMPEINFAPPPQFCGVTNTPCWLHRPPNPTAGTYGYNRNLRTMEVYDGEKWISMRAPDKPEFVVSPTAPSVSTSTGVCSSGTSSWTTSSSGSCTIGVPSGAITFSTTTSSSAVTGMSSVLMPACNSAGPNFRGACYQPYK